MTEAMDGEGVGRGGSSAPFGSLAPRMTTAPPGPASRTWARRLHQVESRNVTRVDEGGPIFWEEALGVNVRDTDGNIYLDLTGAFGVAVAGHRHPTVVSAVRGGLDRLVHGMGDVHPSPERVELLEALVARGPWGEGRGILASSGSEAVETALKTALLATGRAGIAAFEGAYHGVTLGALATTEREHFRGPFRRRTYPGVEFLPFPYSDGEKAGTSPSSEEALRALDRTLAEGAPDGSPVGAVIVEPIQGRAGVRVPPPGFLEEVERRTRASGAVLVCDEVFSGMGRTGRFFAFEAEGITPDLVCLGKALGGGLPLSACLGSREVMDAWPASEGESMHTTTFLGHPLACRAALATLSVLEGEGLLRNAGRVGAVLEEAIREGLGARADQGTIRGRGLFLGATLREPGGVQPSAGGGVRTVRALLERGIIALPSGADGEVVGLSPPLSLDEGLARLAGREVASALLRAADQG